MSESRVQWVEYEDAPEGESLGDRFRHFWKPTQAFTSENLDISVIEMEPEQSGPRHSHEAPVEEYYMVLSGEVVVRLPEETVTGTSGTVFYFPPGEVHQPVNMSEETARLLSLRVTTDEGSRIDLE